MMADVACLPVLTRETRLDWLRFIQDDRPLTLEEISDWCSVKAMEFGWDVLDLTAVLFMIQKPNILWRSRAKAIVQ